MDIDEREEREPGVGYCVAPSLDLQSTDSELTKPENYITPPGSTNTNQKRRRTNLALALILGAAALERVSYYSIEANLQTILDRDYTNANIKVVWILWAGHFFTLVGAWLGENKFGEYNSVIIGLILELLSCLLYLPLLPGLLNYEKGEPIYLAAGEKTSLILSLILLTLGLALTRTNMMILAVQQIQEENVIKNSFFLWFFWFIELGTAGGYAMSGIQQDYVIVAILPVPLLLSLTLIAILPCFVNGLCVTPSSHAFGVLYKSIQIKMPLVFKQRISTDIFNRLSESVQQNIVTHENDLERLFAHIGRISLFTALHIVFESLYGIQTLWTVQIVSNWTSTNWTSTEVDYSWVANLYDPGSVIIVTPFVHFILRQ